jgi:hypothetical protein
VNSPSAAVRPRGRLRACWRQGILALLCAPSLGGCALFTTLWGPAPAFVPAAARSLSRTGLRDFKGIIHCHSFRSHDSIGTIEEIGAACASVGIDFLVMTDHPSPYSVSRGKRGMVGDTLFMVGAELRTPAGTLLAFPLRHYVRPHLTLVQCLAAVHAQGGLAVVGHAEGWQAKAWDTPGLDGVEVHNLHAAAVRASKTGMLVRTLFTPLGTMFGNLARPDPQVLQHWDRAAVRHPLPALGGNDAHANIRVLGSMGWVLGNYHEVFRVLSTHVLAERLDEASVVAAIRHGRTYVVIDLWRDGSGFQFWAEAAGRDHEMGSTVDRGASLRVVVPTRAEIRLLRHGVVVLSEVGEALQHRVAVPGIYRVEVHLDGVPWILSSPIRVR